VEAFVIKTDVRQTQRIHQLSQKAHGITHGFAHFIILTFREADAGSFDQNDVVANQYKEKETNIPIFDK
jgi:hypothetical protein